MSDVLTPHNKLAGAVMHLVRAVAELADVPAVQSDAGQARQDVKVAHAAVLASVEGDTLPLWPFDPDSPSPPVDDKLRSLHEQLRTWNGGADPLDTDPSPLAAIAKAMRDGYFPCKTQADKDRAEAGSDATGVRAAQQLWTEADDLCRRATSTPGVSGDFLASLQSVRRGIKELEGYIRPDDGAVRALLEANHYLRRQIEDAATGCKVGAGDYCEGFLHALHIAITRNNEVIARAEGRQG